MTWLPMIMNYPQQTNIKDSPEASTLLNTMDTRRAYDCHDTEASRTIHDSRHKQPTTEPHQLTGGLLKPLLLGGLDGILTAFAIVAGATGGSLSPNIILILGFSNLLADALSMGVGEFLSSKAENEWILSEKQREQWELENYPEGERQEMVDLYVERGMGRDDAVTVVEIMAKYTEFFVNVMMAEELSLNVPEEGHMWQSVKEGMVMFLSFAGFGSLPLMGYVMLPVFFPEFGEEKLFVLACGMTGVVLFGMGCVKSGFSSAGWFGSGLETLLLGGCCATVAYLMGQFVDGMLDTSSA